MATSTSTTSSHINLRTAFLCIARPHELLPPANAAERLRRARALADDPDYPSAAVIQHLTRKIIAAILLAGRGGGPGHERN